MLIIFSFLFLSQTCYGLNQNRPHLNRNERKTHEGNTGEWWKSWWKNYIQEVTEPTVNPWICCKPQVSYPPPIRPPGGREFPQPPRVSHQEFSSSGFNQLHSSLSIPNQDLLIQNQFGNNRRVTGSVINERNGHFRQNGRGENFPQNGRVGKFSQNGRDRNFLDNERQVYFSQTSIADVREQSRLPQVRKITSKHPRSSISTQYFHLGTVQKDAIAPIDGVIPQISNEKQNVQHVNNGDRQKERIQIKQQSSFHQQFSQNGQRENFPQNERNEHFRQNERGENFLRNGRAGKFRQNGRERNSPQNGRQVYFSQNRRERNFSQNGRQIYFSQNGRNFSQNGRQVYLSQNERGRNFLGNERYLQNSREGITNIEQHFTQNGRGRNFLQNERTRFSENGREKFIQNIRSRVIIQNGSGRKLSPNSHALQNNRNHIRNNFQQNNNGRHIAQNGRNFPQEKRRGHFLSNPQNENIRQTGRNVNLLQNNRETFSRKNSQFFQNGRFNHQFSRERFETYRKPIATEGQFNANQQFQTHRSQINHSRKDNHRQIPSEISFNGNSENNLRNFAVTSTQFQFSNHTRFQRHFELNDSQFSSGNNRVAFNKQNSLREQRNQEFQQNNLRNNFHSINNQHNFFEEHQSTPNRREFHSNRNQLSNNGGQTFSQRRTSFKFSQQISSEFPSTRRQFGNVKTDNSIVTRLPEERNPHFGKDLNLNPQNAPNFRRFQENIRPINFQGVNSEGNFQSDRQRQNNIRQFTPEIKIIQTHRSQQSFARNQQFHPQQYKQQNLNPQQIFPNFPQNNDLILNNPNFQSTGPRLRNPQFQQQERQAFHQSQQRPPFSHPQSSPPHLDQHQKPPFPHSQLRLSLIQQQERPPFPHSQVIPPLPPPIENFEVSRPPRPDGPQVFHVKSRFKVQEDEKSQEFIIEKPYRENEPPFLPQKPHLIEYPQSKIYPPTKTPQYPDKSIKTTFPKQTETYPLTTQTHPPITSVITYPPPVRPPSSSPKDEITIVEKPITSVTPSQEECSTIGPPLILPRPDRPLPDGSIPPCAVGGKNFCLLTNDYPSDLVEEVVDKRKQTVKLMYEEVQTIGDPELFPDHLGNSSASRGDFLCSAEVEYSRPGWIRDELSEEWMLVINTDLFPQKIRTESCRSPNGPCSYVAPFYQSTCQQRFSLHRLLSLDPHDPNRKPVVSLFKFPAGCSCRVDPVKRKGA